MRKYLYLFCLLSMSSVLNCDRLLSWMEPCPHRSDAGELYTNKVRYNQDDVIIITLKNNSTTPLFLPGCSPFYMADKTDRGWIAHPLVVCVWEGYAKKIDPGKIYQEEYPAVLFMGTHRIEATIYWQCQEGRPISEAKCKREERTFSREFIVSQ